MLLQWLSSEGGPLILLAEELLTNWHGTDTTDYDRACSVCEYVGLIPVGSGLGLVFGDEPSMTCYSALSDNSGILVRWICAESEDAVINSLIEIPQNIWQEDKHAIHTKSGNLFLFDSAYPVIERPDQIEITLKPGKYAVETANYQPDSQTELLLHRIKPAN